MRPLLSKIPILLLTLIVGVIASSAAFAQATIVIENADDPGFGFNDTTPVAPVGNNSGTTIGQQRLNAFQFAANVWGTTLTSGPTITIRANWPHDPNDPDVNNRPLPCTATTAILGSAGATSIAHDFPNAPFSGTWYPAALANALRGTDLSPNPEIRARFNPNLGTTGCLENRPWYYGLDNIHGSKIDLVTVLLHEFAHGLGFQTFTNASNGQQAGSAQNGFFQTIYDKFLLDDSTGKTWDQMTDAERVASAINTNNLVWKGTQVDSDATVLTGGKDSSGRPLLYAPSVIQTGSSVSHWDIAATPNQLMEPNINSNLGHGVTVASTPPDLTFSLMRDIGWCLGCPVPPPQPTPTPPANDNFASAQIITGCSGSVTGTNVGATKEAGEPSHSPDGNTGPSSVWYKWQAPSTGSVTVTTLGSDYDTMLGVYTGSSVNALTVALQPDGSPAKNDDVNTSGGILTSSVTFTATAGTIYRIAVDGWGGADGNIVLNWTQSGCSVTAPALLLEQGTENTTKQAAAVDSVTLARGPFSKIDIHNFSSDQITRLMLFTSNLGLSQGENPGLSVQIGGVSAPIENVGTLQGQPQFSYIVVRLDPSVPTGQSNVTVRLHGATSNIGTVNIP